MELALHMGMPSPDKLTQSMTAAELSQWALYASRHSLPFRRLEILLAQISLVMAKTMGGAKEANLNDFMLNVPSDDLPDNVTRIELARKAFGFKPRKPKKVD